MSKTQAQASMFTELRAPKGFEAIYQGQSAEIPIVLSARESGLDPLADAALAQLKAAYTRSKTFPIAAEGNGISPFLVAGTSVPLYSTVCILIPGVSPGDSSLSYKYIIAWRMRTFATAAAGGLAFHGRNSSVGEPDNGESKLSPAPAGAAWSGNSVKRYPAVCATETMDYVQTEVTTPGIPSEENMVEVVSSIAPPYVRRPIFPGFYGGQIAYGDLSQGITRNPTAVSSALRHLSILRRAQADELVLMVYRSTGTETFLNWDFTDSGVDADFPTFYGKGNARTGEKNAGAFVTTGVAP